MVYFKPAHRKDSWSNITRPALHCHGHYKNLINKLLAAYTGEPRPPTLLKEREVLRYSDNKQIQRNKDKIDLCSDLLHYTLPEVSTGDVPTPHSLPGFRGPQAGSSTAAQKCCTFVLFGPAVRTRSKQPSSLC